MILLPTKTTISEVKCRKSLFMEEEIFLSLGVQEYSSVLVFSPPEHHAQEIAHMDLPKGASVSYIGGGMFDVVLIFARNQRDVSELAAAGVAVLKKTGFLWFAYLHRNPSWQLIFLHLKDGILFLMPGGP